MDLLILTAKKVSDHKGIRTELYRHSILYAVIPAHQKQPRINQRTITLNGYKWRLKWNLENISYHNLKLVK